MEHGVPVQAGGPGQSWEQFRRPECPPERDLPKGAGTLGRGVAKHHDSALGKWLNSAAEDTIGQPLPTAWPGRDTPTPPRKPHPTFLAEQRKPEQYSQLSVPLPASGGTSFLYPWPH